MRKILLALTALLLTAGASSADFVYTTSTGNLGTIKTGTSSDTAPSIQYTGTHSSPFLASYWNGSSTRIVLIDRNATESGDRAYVFNPNSLTNYFYSADIEGLHGAELSAYSDNGYSLFLTSGAEVYEVNTISFNVLNSFDCTRVISNDTYATEITGMTVDTSLIHIVASAGDKYRYMRFDGQLDDSKNYFMSADVPTGASPILSSTSDYPIIGHSYGIDMRDRQGNFYRLISTDYPVKAMCQDNGSGFFYVTQHLSGDKYIDTVYHSAADSEFDPYTSESSSANIKMVRDNTSTETFAVMTDEGIALFTYKDKATTLREYTASELGGTPAGIAAAAVSGYNANSSSSGCDVSGLGLVMIAGLIMMRRK